MKTTSDYFAYLQNTSKREWNKAGMYPGLPICLSTHFTVLDKFLTSHELFTNRREMPAPVHYAQPYIGFCYTPGIVSVQLTSVESDRERYTEEYQIIYDELDGIGSQIVVNQYGIRSQGRTLMNEEWYQRFFDVTKIIVDFAKKRDERVALPYARFNGVKTETLID